MNMAADIRFPNLGIELEQVGKTIDVFGFGIAYYGVIMALSIAAGVMMAVWQAKRTGQNPDQYLDFALYVVITSLIGARLYYVAFAWDYYKNDPIQIFNTRGGGMAILGAVIGAITTAIVYCRIKKISFWLFADTGIAGLILGQILGRWGNFFNREAFGDYSGGLLAMQLKQSEVAADSVTAKMLEHLAEVDGATYIQVHPTFLYEMLWNVAVLLLMLFFTKRKKVDGEILLLYLFGYGLGRVWIEGLRTDQLLLWGTNLPVSQLLSVAMMAVAVVLFLTRRLAARRKSASDELAER